MEKKYDLIVVGGGLAGVSAAMEAGRKGLRVLLVEKYNCLGGAAANCLVLPFMRHWTYNPNNGDKVYLTGDLFEEISDELRAMNGLHEAGRIFDEEKLKLILNRMCLKYNVELLFNTTVTDVTMDGDKIVAVQALGKSRKLELFADFFVDATGDAELSMLAGCRCQVGREADGLCQPMTLSFRVGNVDMERFTEDKEKINPLYRQLQAEGAITCPRENVLMFMTMHDGIIHFNTTRVVKHDPTDPEQVTKAELIAREQVFEVHNFLKENIPCFANSYVLSTALQIGIRESRKVLGEYVLTVEDLKSLARFDDAIAISNYDIDIHNPEGAGTSHYYFGKGEWYQIPYRCLLPKDCSNMLVAGRCISSTHEAQASYRIMPYCSSLGQAAGAAVSVAIKNETTLRGVDVEQIRTILRSEGFRL